MHRIYTILEKMAGRSVDESQDDREQQLADQKFGERWLNSVDLLRRHDYSDFWKFYDRYQAFKLSKTKADEKDAHDRSESKTAESKLKLPRSYHKSYRINFTFVTPEMKERGKSKGPSSEFYSELRTVCRHFINFQQKQTLDKIMKIKRDRESLPIWQYKDKIIEAVNQNQVVIVAGDTGCGKSTQVPQYLVEAGFSRIACTQPRRIACISLAKRVGFETLNQYGSDIAYQVRFDTSKTEHTKILFLTEGLLLRQLMADPLLSRYEVVVVDEVHERHINGDFILGILHSLLSQRPDLKVILMSATINIKCVSVCLHNDQSNVGGVFANLSIFR
jgi:HrpA-like RNA helicase